MDACRSTGTSVPRSWGELVPPLSRVRMAVVAALLLLVYWNTVRHSLVERWLHDGDWSHGWLIPLFSLYFLTTKKEELGRVRATPSYWGAAVLALSLAAYFLSTWRLRMLYPQCLSILGAILGLTLLLGGWSVTRIAWFPVAFLIFAIPLPDSIYVQLTMPLQRLAAGVAAAVMPVFAAGLHTQANGVVIDFVMPGMPAGTLNVDEACSGMRSMMAFVALGVAIAYLGQRPVWQRAVLILSCVPIAALCNTIRVTITGLLNVHGHPELARGTAHQVLGVMMFAVALGFYALLGYLLSNLYIEEPGGEIEGRSAV